MSLHSLGFRTLSVGVCVPPTTPSSRPEGPPHNDTFSECPGRRSEPRAPWWSLSGMRWVWSGVLRPFLHVLGGGRRGRFVSWPPSRRLLLLPSYTEVEKPFGDFCLSSSPGPPSHPPRGTLGARTRTPEAQRGRGRTQTRWLQGAGLRGGTQTGGLGDGRKGDRKEGQDSLPGPGSRRRKVHRDRERERARGRVAGGVGAKRRRR